MTYDEKLKQISDAYESVKDAMNFYGVEDNAPFESLRIIRDYAATNLPKEDKKEYCYFAKAGLTQCS
jgi:hypothetical protein